MSNCIIGFKKIKENLRISAIVIHLLRLSLNKSREENINSELSEFNQILKNTFNVKKSNDLSKALTKHYDNLGIKVRKDNVLALDIVITTSPEYWGDWKSEIHTQGFKDKLNTWKAIQMSLIEEKFGKEALKLAVLHLDETTPHIHFFVTPEEEKLVTFKNRYGTTMTQKHVLNNNKHNPKFFTQLVDDLAKVNEKLGLKRGKEGSLLKNIPLKQYKSVLAKDILKAKKLSESYIRALEDDDAKKALIIQLSKDNQSLKKELAGIKASVKATVSNDELKELGL